MTQSTTTEVAEVAYGVESVVDFSDDPTERASVLANFSEDPTEKFSVLTNFSDLNCFVIYISFISDSEDSESLWVFLPAKLRL